ncbi:MAG: ComEA family DNA-binding protein [Planctomycetota bacterium]
MNAAPGCPDPAPPRRQRRAAQPSAAARSRTAALIVCLLVVCVAAGLAWRRAAPLDAAGAVGDGASPAAECIDPNLAATGSLRRLPGIGPRLAGRIVAYRRAWSASHAGPAFRTPDDLRRVRGIGPATVQRIAPYLDLPADPPRPLSR